MKGKAVIVLAFLTGLVVFLAVGCGTGIGQVPIAEVAVAQAGVPRVGEPQVPIDDLTELVAGNSSFAFDLYSALRDQEGNLFFSPYSISLALAMAYAGADGETEAQMARTLNFTLPQDRFHPAFNALDLELASRGRGADGQDGDGFRLNIANSVWGQSGYEFLSEYLEILAKYYGAGLRLVDFEQVPESARLAINRWVEEQTEGRVPDLLPPGSIHPETRLILANTVYFSADWKHPFGKEATRDRPFTLLDGRGTDVPMMSQIVTLPYSQGDGYQVVELPYEGGEFSLVVLLPDPGSFGEFEISLSRAKLEVALDALQPTLMALTLPKFTYESTFTLANTLAAMGMPLALGDGADFSRIDGSDDLFIEDVIHKAFVAVDEQGTEAAAATAELMPSSPPDPAIVIVDRPFIFLIRDTETGTLLFVGRVVDPSS